MDVMTFSSHGEDDDLVEIRLYIYIYIYPPLSKAQTDERLAVLPEAGKSLWLMFLLSLATRKGQ